MKKLIAASILFLALLAPAGAASAQQPVSPAADPSKSGFCTAGSCTYVPLEPLPMLPNCFGPACASQGKEDGSFAGLIGSSYRLLIGAGGLIAIIMIVLGALTYMFSDVVGNKKNALNRIRNAMWAIVLLISSYLILFTINPDLVEFNLKLELVNNYYTSPAAQGTANSSQMTPAQRQAETDKCTQGGKKARYASDGAFICQ